MENIISNPILDRLPAHLKQYIIPQYYDHYSAKDQAVWRYVMRKNISFLQNHAHESYLDGLKKTGITIDKIPSMYGMNRILKDIGWAAASIDGYIPSAPFMEFQAYNVLVIASDIRKQEHIEYTPAPDIIHESSGHSPMLGNPEYAEFLRRFGLIGSKAISSKYDRKLYLAVRKVASMKEHNDINHEDITKAEQELEQVLMESHSFSEMSFVKNLHWWSVEYGLIGSLRNFKLYGAGLLSSIGESQFCLSEKVKKIPFSIDAAYQTFDITRPQPQLFVTPDFAHLSMVLEELADELSMRKGGALGIQRLIHSEQLGTIELSTGLQISGLFSKVILSKKGDIQQPAFIQLKGPTALSHRDKELIGQGVKTHPEGYGSPIGQLKGIHLSLEDMSPRDLQAYGIYEGKKVKLEFASGVKVEGRVISGTRNLQGKIMLISFKECTVRFEDQVLFEPAWGTFDMAVGNKVIAAYAGPADEDSFDLINHTLSEKKSLKLSTKELTLFDKVAKIAGYKMSENDLENMWEEIKKLDPANWLLTLDFYQILYKSEKVLAHEVKQYLLDLGMSNQKVKHLIEDGLSLVQEYR